MPRPGGPKMSTWSRASPRARAASMKRPSCSRTAGWPMYSTRRRGRMRRSTSSSPASRLGRDETVVHSGPARESGPGPASPSGSGATGGPAPVPCRESAPGGGLLGERPLHGADWTSRTRISGTDRPPAHRKLGTGASGDNPLEGRADDRLAVETGRVDRRDPSLRLVRGEAERGEGGDGLGERLLRQPPQPRPPRREADPAARRGSLSAVFLPMPGIRARPAASPARTQRARPSASRPERRASATLPPTPLTLSNRRNVSRSTRRANP